MTHARADAGAAELELRGITKRFGHVTALSDAYLSGYPGSVLAVVGDNGAGKSTLIKIISGVHRPDEGEVRIGGDQVVLRSAADARQAGVATVFQDLALVEVLDVSTNMFLGQFPRRGWFVDRKAMDVESRAVPRGAQGHGRRRSRPRSGCCQAASARSSRSPARCGPAPGSCCSTSRRQPLASARPRMPQVSSVSCETGATP